MKWPRTAARARSPRRVTPATRPSNYGGGRWPTLPRDTPWHPVHRWCLPLARAIPPSREGLMRAKVTSSSERPASARGPQARSRCVSGVTSPPSFHCQLSPLRLRRALSFSAADAIEARRVVLLVWPQRACACFHSSRCPSWTSWKVGLGLAERYTDSSDR